MKKLALLLLVAAAAACQGASPKDAVPAERARDFDVEVGQAAGFGDFPGSPIDLVGRNADEFLVIERGPASKDGRPACPELRARVAGEEREVPLPLRRTDVKGRVTLHVASVTVRQEYENPYDGKIEAVYVFPLPEDAAVTDFLLRIGERTIRGIVREREEARHIYLEARRQGHVASLLTQERPNVFTQSVANIEPGKRIDVEIAYFHAVRYVDGEYELVFPMVVGPRFNPPGSTDGIGTGSSGQPTEVPYLRPGETSAHRVSLSLAVDAGFPIDAPSSPSHAVDVAPTGEGAFAVSLKDGDRLPDRDFVLRWRVAPERVSGALRTCGEHFLLVLQPPASLEDVPRQPREMVFVVDCSGSMKGEPLAACKRAMRNCLRRLDGNDTFRLVRFSDAASAMERGPLPATPANLERARRWVDGLATDGGTMMIHGIRAALDAPRDSERYRIVTFMTDGFIGNEREILAEVCARVGDARIFSFGVGNSVNRYLLERMAQAGRGVAAYVRIDESGERAVDGLYRRLEQPALTDVRIDWGAMGATDVYPEVLPDLFVGRPVVVAGRFHGRGRTEVRVRGRMGSRPAELAIPVDPGDAGATHEAIAKLWARARIASLDDRIDRGGNAQELADAIRDTALEHGLVSAFTAFVAVDSTRRTEGDHGTTVPVPVPVPQGTRYETTVR